jgi:hypothetical protein
MFFCDEVWIDSRGPGMDRAGILPASGSAPVHGPGLEGHTAIAIWDAGVGIQSGRSLAI